MREASLYQSLPEKKVKCTACNWYCTIPEGKTGVCGIRQNRRGKLQLLTYGKPVAVHVDPIEKKPLYHFLPGTDIFSLGTVGCNLRCGFCQNWDISQAVRETKKTGSMNEKRIVQMIQDTGENWLPEKIVRHCFKHGIPSIAYTYNEPAIFFEYALDTAKLGQEYGIKNVFVSNGYLSREAIETIGPYLNAINIDLKSFSDSFYRKNCGASLEPVLKNIQCIAKTSIWMEITTLLIPGENDSRTELREIAEFLAEINPDIPWHVTAFHPDYKMLDKNPTPVKTVQRACETGKKTGLNFVYSGNIAETGFVDTLCSRCKKTLIQRIGNSVKKNSIREGCCSFCGELVPGVWKP
jgi:pyruvate formate lyase activating enzyme